MEKSDRKPETIVMSIALEMKASIVQLAGPRSHADTKESMIARAARKARISYRQAKAFYYGETMNPRACVVERVREAIAGSSFHSKGILHHAEQMESAALKLEALDAALHRTEVDRLRYAALVIRGVAARNSGF